MANKITDNMLVFGAGAPSCGKRTALVRLARNNDGAYMDVGGLLRTIKHRITGKGESDPEIDKAFIDSLLSGELGQLFSLESLKPLMGGGLVDDGLILRMLYAWIKAQRERKLAILDGAPRTKAQASALLHHAKHQTRFTASTVWFTTSIAACLARPARPGREDDDPATRAGRMADYQRDTLPIFSMMRSRTNMIAIDNEHLTPGETLMTLTEKLGLGKAAASPSPLLAAVAAT